MAVQGGFGLTLQISITAVYTTITYLLDCDFPEQAKTLEEVTPHSATSGYATHAASGKRELGEFTATLQWAKSEATHAAILTAYGTNATVDMKIIDVGTAETIQFAAHVKSIKRISKQDEAYKAEVTFQPSGAPTIT